MLKLIHLTRKYHYYFDFKDESESSIEEKTKQSTKTPSKSILKTPKAKTPATIGRKSTISRRSTIARSTVMTPSLQKRTNLKATSKKELSAYEKARIKLHATNTPDCLPCRENQFSDIYTFIETHIKNQNGGCKLTKTFLIIKRLIFRYITKVCMFVEYQEQAKH